MRNKIIFLRKTAGLTLFISLLLNGCTNILPTAAPTSKPTAVVTPTVLGVELAFETIEKSEAGGGYQGRNPRMVILTKTEEVDLLGDSISVSAQDELRKLDFNQVFVIAVFQGLKGSDMYGVDILRASERGNTITIFAHFTEPNPELESHPINTSPYHIVEVSKDGLRGEFDFLLNVDGEIILKVSSTL